jgi:hypothetical protein
VAALLLAAVLTTAICLRLAAPAPPNQGGAALPRQDPPQFPGVRSAVDPDAELRAIQAELASGRPATLIGERGGPRWSRWMQGDAPLRESPILDGAFAFQTQTTSYLELLPDPMRQRYVFSAEVRHDSMTADDDSFVGLYFGHVRYELPGGNRAHGGQRVFFREGLTQAELKKPRPAERHAYVHLENFIRKQRPGENETGHRCGPPRRPFEPQEIDPKPWRKLVVEVSPDLLRVRWGDQRAVATLWELSAADLRAQTESLRNELSRFPIAPGVELVLADWSPRAALGLYVFRGSVSYRNVVVQPLPDPS